MGYYEERKAREAGEEAQRRGMGSYNNPYDRFSTNYDTERCHDEWNRGYRAMERLEDERREREEAEQRREARMAEELRRQEEEERYWQEQEEENREECEEE